MFGLIPWRSRSRMLVDPDELFNSFWSGFWSLAAGDFGRADIVENQDEYVLEVDLPGLDKDSIVVEASEDGTLSVKVNRKVEQEETKGNYIRKERRMSQFHRTFQFDGDADLSSVEASYRNGVLRLRVPKRQPPEGKSRRIEIA